MIEINIANPFSKTHLVIKEVRGKLNLLSVPYSFVSPPRPSPPHIIECWVESQGRQYCGRVHDKTSSESAYDLAELKALLLLLEQSVEVKYSGDPISEKEIVVWNRKKVMEYKTKGVERLLDSMLESGIDVDPFIQYRNELAATGKRLTIQEIARRFFPASSGLTTVTEKPKKPASTGKTTKREARENWFDVFDDLSADGWTEDKFSKTKWAESFKTLEEFAKFATDEEIQELAQTSAE